MRLSAFRIYNFRSIVDTGWQNLSPDNITCLIGQNESGKTSVLEGLNVFNKGLISEDVLRSDMSLPKVCCKFDIPGEKVAEWLSGSEMELMNIIRKIDSVVIEREWKADLSSEVQVGGEILEYLLDLEARKSARIDDSRNKVLAVGHEIDTARSQLDFLHDRLKDLKAKLPEDERRSTGLRLFRKKDSEVNPEQEKYKNEILKEIKEKKAELEKTSKILDDRSTLAKEIDLLNKHLIDQSLAQEKMEEISLKLEERHQTMTLLSGPSLQDLSVGEWEKVLSDYRSIRAEQLSLDEKVARQILICDFMHKGKAYEIACDETALELENFNSGYSAKSIGEIIIEETPYFEIFEDFGSLLPNRIDLEDIISENADVEGYKAARNFLTIASLDYSFFQQPSSRILKQKIENLNSRLTLDFQDFWQQYVGRKNKIRISFELDHYNTSHGDKAGKPYLEFWVKDEGERLYPKQRSRGVRWFLSFYLELMAASARENQHLVLLVDEPGVSLHARAQEDVLKVFEDIKKNIQVIYTTHSPHLVDIDKLHRVLAIQRDDIENQRSATTILDPVRLIDASPDTLSPLQSIMGNPVGNQEFSADKFNIIVNDIGTYYLLTAALSLIGYKGIIHFIPSTDTSSIPLMCNILMGWGMSFAVLLFNNDEELDVSEQLKGLAFTDNIANHDLIVVMPEGFQNAEDLLSTLDFKNYILHSREGITVPNSEYIKEKDLPRNFLLSKFLSDVKAGKVSRDNFDEETRENLMLLLNILQKYK